MCKGVQTGFDTCLHLAIEVPVDCVERVDILLSDFTRPTRGRAVAPRGETNHYLEEPRGGLALLNFLSAWDPTPLSVSG